MTSIDLIKTGTDTLIGTEELSKKLESQKKLKIKLGVDPTRPDLTFGHMVVFNKLRQFQDLGHEAILLIGDYTAMIGDPSGRSSTRPVLTERDIKENAKTYLDQAFKILDREKTTVRYNSEWLKPLSFADALLLARRMTVARMLERDDFSKRFRENIPISIVEFMYPLLQGYDSVALQSDVELGGTDQLFNMLVGRQFQKEEGQSEQAVICMPLLVGLDGVKKMSKSMDNYIAFNDTPKEMFGKIMSISDEVMWDYYTLLLMTPQDEIKRLQKGHPMEAKKQLALKLLTKLYDEATALYELGQFEQVFSHNQLPDDMPTFSWSALSQSEEATLTDLMQATKLFPSKKEIRRLIEQGAVKLNSEKQTDPFLTLHPPLEDPFIIQSGKRTFIKIKE